MCSCLYAKCRAAIQRRTNHSRGFAIVHTSGCFRDKSTSRIGASGAYTGRPSDTNNGGKPLSNSSRFYAHSTDTADRTDWQPLADHLNAVALLAGRFARPFGAEALAHVAGLLHDLGKYTVEFQRRLEGEEPASITRPGAQSSLANDMDALDGSSPMRSRDITRDSPMAAKPANGRRSTNDLRRGCRICRPHSSANSPCQRRPPKSCRQNCGETKPERNFNSRC